MMSGSGLHPAGAGLSWPVQGAGRAVPGFPHMKGEERPGSGRLRVTTPCNCRKLGALLAMQHNGWDHGLKVTADGADLVGNVGAVLLRKGR